MSRPWAFQKDPSRIGSSGWAGAGAANPTSRRVREAAERIRVDMGFGDRGQVTGLRSVAQRGNERPRNIKQGSGKGFKLETGRVSVIVRWRLIEKTDVSRFPGRGHRRNGICFRRSKTAGTIKASCPGREKLIDRGRFSACDFPQRSALLGSWNRLHPSSPRSSLRIGRVVLA